MPITKGGLTAKTWNNYDGNRRIFSFVRVDGEPDAATRGEEYVRLYNQYASFLRNQFKLQDSHECDALLGDPARIEAYKKQAAIYTTTDADFNYDDRPFWDWHKTHLHIPVNLSEKELKIVSAAVETPAIIASLNMVLRECARGPDEFRTVRSRDISCVCTGLPKEAGAQHLGVATDLLRPYIFAITKGLPRIPLVKNRVTPLPPPSAFLSLIAEGTNQRDFSCGRTR